MTYTEWENIVHTELDNAVKNGYHEIKEWDDLRLAEDLLDFSTAVEGLQFTMLLQMVRTWKGINNG